jgi:glycosyltransferase involved in cell wall biosynthesis
VVGISLLTLTPGRMGGSEAYARALTAALARHGAHKYLVAVPPAAGDAAGGLLAVVGGAKAGRPKPRVFVRAALAGSTLAAASVVHYPLTVPLPPTHRPRVLTLHDVLHLDLPELVPRRVRTFRRVAYDAAARHADRVIVPSAFVRVRALERLGLDPGRVRVVHHGVDHDVFCPDGGPREPFLLYPARPWPHKEHALLFAAFGLVRRDRPELELVLTGGGHESLQLPPGVRSAGAVPVAELAELYRRASALVFPSRYEGFGSPVLEAMASGCPVAAASGTAVEEVAGDAAVLFAPRSAEAAAEGILRALAEAEALSERGLARAREFSWERSARLHDEVYAELGA